MARDFKMIDGERRVKIVGLKPRSNAEFLYAFVVRLLSPGLSSNDLSVPIHDSIEGACVAPSTGEVRRVSPSKAQHLKEF
jgi:hypothetical protein